MKHLKAFESYYDNPVFSELIGKSITNILINSENSIILFKTGHDEEFAYCCEGDCCNDVWIEHLNGIDCIIDGSTIFDVKSKGSEDRTPTKQEVEEALLWTIYTSSGNFDIEVRNSHNGYYGGSMYYMGSGLNSDNEDFREVKEDF